MTRRTITLDELDHFELDDTTGRLYWKGTPVMMESTFTLPWWANIAIVAAGVGSLVQAIATIVGLVVGTHA